MVTFQASTTRKLLPKGHPFIMRCKKFPTTQYIVPTYSLCITNCGQNIFCNTTENSPLILLWWGVGFIHQSLCRPREDLYVGGLDEVSLRPRHKRLLPLPVVGLAREENDGSLIAPAAKLAA